MDSGLIGIYLYMYRWSILGVLVVGIHVVRE